jgi:hypothetical protein
MLYVQLLQLWPLLFLVQHGHLKLFHAPADTLNTLQKYYRAVAECNVTFVPPYNPILLLQFFFKQRTN